MVEWIRVLLKIIMWVLVVGFGCNLIMQIISYSFYKNAKNMENLSGSSTALQFGDNLSGFGANLDVKSEYIILFFGGSNYIAYNAVGRFSTGFNVPFLSADYYGSQDSKGKMNLSSMQQTATDLYDWARKNYPTQHIVVMGHSYGAGIATYLASVRNCKGLVLLSAYRDISDLYNKITPIFWGPAKIFISNNICLSEYAKKVNCPTYIIGSNADTILSSNLQYKVQECFESADIVIFDDVPHEDYLINEKVLDCIKEKLLSVL